MSTKVFDTFFEQLDNIPSDAIEVTLFDNNSFAWGFYEGRLAARACFQQYGELPPSSPLRPANSDD